MIALFIRKKKLQIKTGCQIIPTSFYEVGHTKWSQSRFSTLWLEHIPSAVILDSYRFYPDHLNRKTPLKTALVLHKMQCLW